MSDKHVKLTRVERLLLANQLRIMEKLYPDEERDFARHRKALEEGFELHYAWLFQSIYDDAEIMTIDESQFVLDVLDMYSHLLQSYNVLSDQAGIPPDRIRFGGFDGNNETKYLAFCQYWLFDLERFTDLIPDKAKVSLNAHREMKDSYMRMLRVWKKHREEMLRTSMIKALSKEMILEILDAA